MLYDIHNIGQEIWKDIPGYEGKYKVSRGGNVLSLNFSRKGETKELSKIIKSSGYYVVTLSGKQKFVHRLVAEAFCDHPKGCDIVDHINTITTDNRAENLRWTDAAGNVNNPISRNRRTESTRRRCKGKLGIESPKHRGCIQMDLDGRVIKSWGCMSDAWRELRIDSGSLTKACQGKQASAGGFRWEYTD